MQDILENIKGDKSDINPKNKLKILEESFKEGVITEEEHKKQKEEIEKEIKNTEKKEPIKEPETKEEKKDIPITLKKNKFLIPLIIILFVIAISVYIRIQPLYLPVMDKFSEELVHESIKSEIKKSIDLQYSNLPKSERDKFINAEFEKAIKEPAVKKLVKSESEYGKSNFKDEHGLTYLAGIDPYLWLRYADNIVKTGHPGDEIRYGKEWDSYINAPAGSAITGGMFHPYFEAYLFKIVRFFNKDMYLMKLAFYIPIIIMALSVIPAFFIARKFGGNFAGFVASILLIAHQIALNRTMGGFPDTDSYNILFPLLIIWLFVLTFKSKSKINMFSLSLLQGFLIGLYSFTWIGWWYIFDFILITYVVSLMFYSVYHIKGIKKGIMHFLKIPDISKTIILFIIFILFSGIFVSIFSDFNTFSGTLLQPFQFTKLKGVEDLWPSAFATIEELEKISFYDVKARIGKTLLFLSLIGVLLTTIKNNYKKYMWRILLSSIIFMALLQINNIFYFLLIFSIPIIIRFIWVLKDRDGAVKTDISIAILLIVWFTATLYTVNSGIRWLLLFAPPFSIAAGIALGRIYSYLNSLLIKGMEINKNLSKLIIILLLSILLVAPLNMGIDKSKKGYPDMNDAWYTSLEKIKIESAPDAIITSWWDFGHWFKAIGDRAVTFDGGTQGAIYWVGRALLTSNEKESVGIIRMLGCRTYLTFDNPDDSICPSINNVKMSDCIMNVYEKLNHYINDQVKSIDIIHEIAALDKETAKKRLLGYNLNEKQAEGVLEFSHCDPPENYFITSEDMVKKGAIWAHFGSWNFNKAQIYNTLNKEEYQRDRQLAIDYIIKRFNYTEKEAENTYHDVQSLTSSEDANNWIAPWPAYNQELRECKRLSNETFVCPIGEGTSLLNISTMDVYIRTPEGIKHPNTLIYPSKNKLIKKYYNNTIEYSMILIPFNEGFKSITMSPQLTESMFTRLFFFDGMSLKHFKKFSDERDLFDKRIIIWKIDWQGNETNP